MQATKTAVSLGMELMLINNHFLVQNRLQHKQMLMLHIASFKFM